MILGLMLIIIIVLLVSVLMALFKITHLFNEMLQYEKFIWHHLCDKLHSLPSIPSQADLFLKSGMSEQFLKSIRAQKKES